MQKGVFGQPGNEAFILALHNPRTGLVAVLGGSLQKAGFVGNNLAQLMYAQVNHEYPLKAGVGLSGIVSSFGDEQSSVKKGAFKRDDVSLATVGKNRTEAIKIMNEVGYE